MNILLKFKRGQKSPSQCVSDSKKSRKSHDTQFTTPGQVQKQMGNIKSAQQEVEILDQHFDNSEPQGRKKGSRSSSKNDRGCKTGGKAANMSERKVQEFTTPGIVEDKFSNISRAIEPNQVASTLKMSASNVNQSMQFKLSNIQNSNFHVMKNPSLVQNSMTESRRLKEKTACKNSGVRDSKSPKDTLGYSKRSGQFTKTSTKKHLHHQNSPKPMLKESQNTLNTSRGMKNESNELYMSSLLMNQSHSKTANPTSQSHNLPIKKNSQMITDDQDTYSALEILNQKYNLGLSSMKKKKSIETSKIVEDVQQVNGPLQYSFVGNLQEKRSYEEYQTAGFGNEDEVKMFESQTPLEFRSKVFESNVQSEGVKNLISNPKNEQNFTRQNIFKINEETSRASRTLRDPQSEAKDRSNSKKIQGKSPRSSPRYSPLRPNTESFRGTLNSESDPYSKEEQSLGSFGTKLTRRTHQNTKKRLSRSPKSIKRSSQANRSATKKKLISDFTNELDKENDPSFVNRNFDEYSELEENPHAVDKPPIVPLKDKDIFIRNLKSKYKYNDICSPRISNRPSYTSIRSFNTRPSRSNSPFEEAPKSYAISSMIKTRPSQQNLHETPLSPVRSFKRLNMQTSTGKNLVHSLIRKYPINLYDISSYLKYTGKLNNIGEYEGYGRIDANNGEEVYVGDFRSGKYDGIGRIVNYLNQKEGFLANMPSLKSRIKLRFFSIGSSNLSKNIYGVKMSGKIQFSDNDWVSYSGGFKKGKMHGYGKLVLKDGKVFEGKFENGKAAGMGVQMADGFKTVGIWDKNLIKQYY